MKNALPLAVTLVAVCLLSACAAGTNDAAYERTASTPPI